MESPVDKSMGKVTVPCVFTFVPVVQKLPIKSCLETTSVASEDEQHKNMAEETTREAMSGEQVLTASYIPCSQEKEGNSCKQSEGNTHRSTPPCGLVTGSAPTVSNQSENNPHWRQDTMKLVPNIHADVSELRYQSVPGRASEVRYFKTQQASASPTHSADLYPTPASSRESILSADSDKNASPISGSRTISPCSSVYSGIFTPSIVPVKKHFLAPGSSLISLPQSCRSSYESLSCPMSPTPVRQRPPLTRLSLLTAILRKGRLPILSSTVQRPYTPCWPVNRITLSHCTACSAASSVASIPLELSSEFSSSTSIDSQSDTHRDLSRCATAPPLLSNSKCPQNQTRTGKLNAVPRWQKTTSPRSTLNSHKKNNLQQEPQPVCSSVVKSVSPINLHRSYVSISKPKSPTLKPSFCLSVDSKHNKRLCLSPEPELNTGVPERWTLLPSSSFSKLQSLSHQLKTPSHLSCSSENVTPFSPSPPPARLTVEKPRVAGYSQPKSSPLMSHCLFPSRNTLVDFTGWPSPYATPSPTPTPSPALPIRELTPSPVLSLCSTPSPRPGSGRLDGADREGEKRKPHKIKSSYKSLAAIPTNTLLLDQQVIDEQVERAEDTTWDKGVPSDIAQKDTRSEMCSPAWLRKESEELYAVIDEILASSLSSTSKSPSVKEVQKNYSAFPRNYGRETKYASVCSLTSNGSNNRKADFHETKPGVIRGPPLTTQYHNKKSECTPLKKFVVSQRHSDSTKELHNSALQVKKKRGENTCGSKTQREEECFSGTSACDLHITEPEEHMQHSLKHGPPLCTTTSFCPAERKPEAFETQI